MDVEKESIPQRRRYKRRKFSARVGVFYDGMFLFETAQEISEGGMLLRVSCLVNVGTNVGLQFFLPNGKFISTHGQVVYNLEPNTGERYVGVAFINPTPDLCAQVHEYVEKHQ